MQKTSAFMSWSLRSHASAIAPIAGIAFGLTVILHAILPHGIGLSEDSISYLSAANSLYDSYKMIDIDGTPFVSWAPLYPLIIALLKFLSFKIESSLAIFNVLVYALTILTSWLLMQQSIGKTFFRIACLLSIVFSFTILQVYSSALSEALFLLLLNLVILIILRMRKERGIADFILLALTVALAMLQRYAGVFLMLFIILSFFSNCKSQFALRILIIIMLSAIIPIGIWLLRNLLVADTLTGFRSCNIERLGNNLITLAETFTSWALPMNIPLRGRLMIFIPVIYAAWKGAVKNRIQAWFILAYLSLLAFCYFVFSFEEPRDRLLSPVFIPFFVLTFSGLELIAEKTITQKVIIIMVCVWMAYPVFRTFKHARIWHDEGADVYNKPSWKDSPMISLLKANEFNGNIFSNDASAIYYFTGKSAARVPKSIYGTEAFQQSVENGDCLVWWESREWHDLQLIGEKCILTATIKVNDGAVFTIHKR